MSKCSLGVGLQEKLEKQGYFYDGGLGINYQKSNHGANEIRKTYQDYYMVDLGMPLDGMDLDISAYTRFDKQLELEAKRLIPKFDRMKVRNLGKDKHIILSNKDLIHMFVLEDKYHKIPVYTNSSISELKPKKVYAIDLLKNSKTEDVKSIMEYGKSLSDTDFRVVTAHNKTIGAAKRDVQALQDDIMDNPQFKDKDDKGKLDTILNTFGTEINKASNEMFDEVISRMGTNGKVSYGYTIAKDSGQGISGKADLSTVTVYLPMNSEENLDVAYQNIANTYVHEKGHLVTHSLYLQDSAFKERIDALYQHALLFGDSETYYGLETVQEFMTEAFSNPSFQEFLNDIENIEGYSVWDRFLNALFEAIRVVIPNYNTDSVLHEVLATTADAMGRAINRKGRLHAGTGLDGDILSIMQDDGTIDLTDKVSIAYANDFATKYDMTVFKSKDGKTAVFGVEPVQNPFKEQVKGKVKKFNKAELTAHMNIREMGGLLYSETLSEELYTDKASVKLEPLYQKRSDVNLIHNHEDITDSIGEAIKKPGDSPTGLYTINDNLYWRATSYLGLSDDQISGWVATNSSRIGNIVDEIGKRVFRNNNEDLSYDSVIDFVKREDNDGLDWTKTPMQRDVFDTVVAGLKNARQNMMRDYGFTEFKVDIIYWDHDSMVAGEADVVGVKPDGSFTVIDLKTRRAGMEGYNTEWGKGDGKRSMSDREKHTKQTNFYSDMGSRIMNAKFNNPLIVMLSPDYALDKEVENVQFGDIIDNDVVNVIELERTEMEDRFKSRDLLGDLSAPKMKYIRANRKEYTKWFNSIKNKTNPLYNSKRAEANKIAVNQHITHLADTVSQYISLSGKDKVKSPELLQILKDMENEVDQSIDLLTLEEMLQTANDFFVFAATEMEEMNFRIENEMAETDLQTDLDFFNKIKKYGEVFNEVEKIYNTIVGVEDTEVGDVALLNELKGNYGKLAIQLAHQNAVIKSKRKSLVARLLKDSYLGSVAEIKHKQAFQKEAERLGLKGGEAETYVVEQMSTEAFRDQLTEEYAKEIDKLVSSIQDDIFNATLWMLSDVEVNSPYIQLMHAALMQAKQEFSQQVNDEMIEFDKQRRRLSLSKSQLDELIVEDSNGNLLLRSLYKIEFLEQQDAYRRELEELLEARRQDDLTQEEYRQINEDLIRVRRESAAWNANNLQTINGARVPTDNWLDPKYNTLSDKQKQALSLFEDIQIQNDTNRINSRPLSRHRYGASFFYLPKMLATSFGNIAEGQFLAAIKKQINETFSVEEDDTDFGERGKENISKVYAGLDNKPIKSSPIFYRRDIPKHKNQNKDLFSVYALEKVNGIRYKIDSKAAQKGQLVKDFVETQEFYKTDGLKKKMMSIFSRRSSNKFLTMNGDESNVARFLGKMLDNQTYSIMHEPSYGIQIMGKQIDGNRLTSFVSSYTSFAAMAFKTVSAANNWVTGNVSMAIEAAGGEFMGKSNLRKAKSTYRANLMGILADLGSPVKRNHVNQLMAFFDVASDLAHLSSRFERTSTRSGLLEPGLALGGYGMGEHEIHATLMMSLLDGAKLLNKEGKYLDRNGDIVSRKEAASMLDVLNKSQYGNMEVAEWMKDNDQVFTTFDQVSPISKGGMAGLRALIKDRVVRTQGAFGKDTQPLIDRLWWGKLVKQFKKHIVPQTLNRFRGLNNVGKNTQNIEDRYKYFNLQAKTEEYGYYVSFMRYLQQTILSTNELVNSKEFESVWESMTLHERANVKKTITELSYILTVVLLAAAAGAAIDGEDDEEKSWLIYNIFYVLKRQIGDAGLDYYDPSNMWRLTDSPAAAFKKMDLLFDALALVFPWNWGEFTREYKGGYNKGKNVGWTKIKKATIIGDIDQQFKKAFVKKRASNMK